MFSRIHLFRSIAVAVLVLCLSVLAFADTLRLKDGSIIKGKIISFSGGKFVVLIGEGDRQRQLTFFADEIDSIEFDGTGGPSTTLPSANGSERGKPAFTETTNGNETIITVGSARRDNESISRSERPAESYPVVDPDAVAIDPNAGADQPISGDPIGDDVVIDDDPILDEPAEVENTSQPASDPTAPKPVQIKINVLADNTANGWTNAGWVVKKGQKIRIISNGRISLGNGRFSGPRGIATLPDQNKLIKDRPTGSLIAVIGDDNNEFIYIGENREFIAERDGALFLGVNEGNLDDNSGSFDVIIEIEPAGS